MEIASIAIRVNTCQRGISETPSRSMIWTGGVTGKLVKMTQAGLLGKNIKWERNQTGAKPVHVYIRANCCEEQVHQNKIYGTENDEIGWYV